MNNYFIAILLMFGVWSGCKKDEIIPVDATEKKLSLSFSYNVDTVPLLFNSIQYQNAAGNVYSITKLKYYLSQISLVTTSNSKVLLANYLLVDAESTQDISIDISSIPNGNYKGLSFNIGLDSSQNISGGLPATIGNLSMEWPVAMGGGYHFLMLEGHFTDSSGTPGYAMHLGTNASLCSVILNHSITINQNDNNIRLDMNINEWFRNPNVFDFNTDGNYIMGNMQAMSKFAANGVDVFSIH